MTEPNPSLPPRPATPPRPSSAPTPAPAPVPVADGLFSAAARRLRELGHAVSHPSHPPTPLLADAPRHWQRLLPYAVVLAVVCSLFPVTIVVLINNYAVPGGVAFALATLQVLPLSMMGHRPLQTWWIVFPSGVLGSLLLPHTPAEQGNAIWPWPAPAIVGMLLLLFALGLRESRNALIGVWICTAVAGIALGQFFPRENDGTNVVTVVLSGIVLVVGGVLRERGEVQRRLVEQETISEAERAHRTLLEERTRIARELHDVVAHHMSVITVQADSAPYRIGGLPPAAAEEFASIAASARESLTEMRRLLVVLRSEGAEGERAPQPGLDKLQQLVEATVRAGVPATLSLATELRAKRPTEPGNRTRTEPSTEPSTDPGAEPDTWTVPQAVDLSAYRIVQEALANVVRHAPGAATRVSVRVEETDLLVLVVNAPAPAPDSAARTGRVEAKGAGGHGLVGMRERVRLTGGTLDTGPLPDGGFRVAARLPLTKTATKQPASKTLTSKNPATKNPPTKNSAAKDSPGP